MIFILCDNGAEQNSGHGVSRASAMISGAITTDTIAARLRTRSCRAHSGGRGRTALHRGAGGRARCADALSLLDECVAFCPDGEIRYEAVLNILGAVDVEVFSKTVSRPALRQDR